MILNSRLGTFAYTDVKGVKALGLLNNHYAYVIDKLNVIVNIVSKLTITFERSH